MVLYLKGIKLDFEDSFNAISLIKIVMFFKDTNRESFVPS